MGVLALSHGVVCSYAACDGVTFMHYMLIGVNNVFLLCTSFKSNPLNFDKECSHDLCVRDIM